MMPIDHDEQPSDAWGAAPVRTRKQAPPAPELELTLPDPLDTDPADTDSTNTAPTNTAPVETNPTSRETDPVPPVDPEASAPDPSPSPVDAATQRTSRPTTSPPLATTRRTASHTDGRTASDGSGTTVGEEGRGDRSEPRRPAGPAALAPTMASPSADATAAVTQPVDVAVTDPEGRDAGAGRGDADGVVPASGTVSFTLPEGTAERFEQLVEADPLGLARHDLLVSWLDVVEDTAPALVAELAALVPVDRDGRATVTPRLQAAPGEPTRRMVLWIRGESRARLDRTVATLRDRLAVFDVTMSWTLATAIESAWARHAGLDDTEVAARVAHVAGRRQR